MNMDKRFADWYRLVDPNLSEERLNKRASGLSQFSEEATIDKSLDAVRLFYGIQVKDSEFEEWFGNIFYEKDNTFGLSGSDNEASILAGCAAHQFANSEASLPQAIATELALVSVHCKGISRTAPVPDIVQDCQDKLIEASSKLRDQKSFPTPKAANPNYKAILEPLRENQLSDHHQVGQKVVEAVEAIANSIRQVSRQNQPVHRANRLIQEEVNILWWLFGERSHSANAHFSSFDNGAACFIGAFDMAELTDFRPGPFASEAFLAKVLSYKKGKLPKKIQIREAIEQCPSDWAKLVCNEFGESAFLDLCPLYSCLCDFAKVDGDEAWVTVAEKNRYVDTSSSIPPLDLAIQVYQEGLLLRAEPELTEA